MRKIDYPVVELSDITDELIINLFFTRKSGRINTNVVTHYKNEEFETDNIVIYLNNRFSDSESMSETLWRIKLGIEERPKCSREGCENKVKYISTGRFHKHCSARCSTLDETTKQKMKETNLKKHGVEYYASSDEYKERFKNISLERYGVESLLSSPEIIAKREATCLEKYGVKHYTNREKFKETMRIKNAERRVASLLRRKEERAKRIEARERKNAERKEKIRLKREELLNNFYRCLNVDENATQDERIKRSKEEYDRIIRESQSVQDSITDFEIHHILPKCVGGDNSKSNLIKLSYSDHFRCHRLLCDIYPDNKKLIYAFWMMVNTSIKSSNTTNRDAELDKSLITPEKYEEYRTMYVNMMKGRKLSSEFKKKISRTTYEGMRKTNIIQSCRKGAEKSRHYYNKITHESFKWFEGDPEIDLMVYEWGRPPMSEEQKARISNIKNISKTKYINHKIRMVYTAYDKYVSSMPEGWELGWTFSYNSKKFKQIMNQVKNEITDRGYFIKEDIFIKTPDFSGRALRVMSPSIFEVCEDILVGWEDDSDIVKKLSDRIIEKIEEIRNLNKKYLKRSVKTEDEETDGYVPDGCDTSLKTE